jgi:hypothetical protein
MKYHHSKLREFIRSSLLEMSTRYKRETGENFPRWQEKLKKYEDEGGKFFWKNMGIGA